MERKKIGLLTLPLKDNYGGIIQIIALKFYLENELGHSTILLDKQYNKPFLKNLLAKLFEFNPLYKIYDRKDAKKKAIYLKKIKDFIQVSFPTKTQPFYDYKKFESYVSTLNIDAVIVGSDQVWRMSFIEPNYKDYFLDFVNSKNTKKIAYAASFGKDEWNKPDYTESVKSLVNKFTAVSVREDSGKKICSQVFNTEAEHVLDPTLLHDQVFYDNIIEKDSDLAKQKIELFNYVLDQSSFNKDLINKTSEATKLKINTISLQNDFKNFKAGKTYKPSISEWLYHFKSAKFIITDSFHGTVFSIIYNKPFIAIGNLERGLTRFTSLLNALGLSDRLITQNTDPNKIHDIINTPIDYNTVNKNIELWKNRSVNFLKEALS